MMALAITLVVALVIAFAFTRTPLAFVYSYFLHPTKMIKGSVQLLKADDVPFFIYLPEGYNDKLHDKYPVIYHLHGAIPFKWNIAKKMIRKDVVFSAGLLEKLCDVDKADQHIIVAPYDGLGMSMWSNAHDGHVMAESDLIDTLIPHVQINYRIHTDAQYTTIQGFSMGGFGATKLAFKYPDKFGKLISLDGALHNWQTISSKRKSIAANIFKTEHKFMENSPWLLSEQFAKSNGSNNLKIHIIEGWVKEYNQYFKKHLERLSINFNYVVTHRPHDVFQILNHPQVGVIYHKE